MTIHKIIFLIFSVILLSYNVSAQSEEQRQIITRDYDIKKLKALSKQFSENYKRDKSHALAYALKHDIEVVKNHPDGGISILEKVLDDGTLIYVSTYNAGAASTLNTDELYEGGNLGLSLSGHGINFGIWDGGLVRDTHQELVGRVVQLDNPNNFSNHATHVSGTMIASGVDPSAKGMAFEAELTAYDFQNDLNEMANEAMNGMLVSNHSYGLNPTSIQDAVFGAYLSITADVDELVFNAPNYLPVFAAGNSRNVPPFQGGPFNDSKNGFDLISGKNLAKNILSVANVLEVNNYVDASSVVMSNDSSWGPTDDGRIKPDISAKGTNTFSSFATNDDAYNFRSGTSMAAPNVSGSLGLLHQHYNNIYGGFLNAASMKALVIHTAREAGDHPGPDYKYGWGLMDTAAAAEVISNQSFTSIIEENTLNDGDTYSFTVDAIDPNTPLVATIVWTDPAGSTQDTSNADDSTTRLVNDLDIRVIAPDAFTEFLPWTLTGLLPDLPAAKADNSVDNVEKIEVENATGQYTIEVTHKGNLQNQAQDYSIIISGIAESSIAVITDQSSKSVCANETAIFNFDVNTIASFTGNINFSQTGLPNTLNASFSPASLNNQGETSLSIDNLQNVAAGDYPFTVTATSGSESFSVDLNLNIIAANGLNNLSLLNNNGFSLTPEFMWQPLTSASSYEIQISTSPNFDVLLFSFITEDTEFETPELDYGETYYWRVRALSECEQGPFISDVYSTIDPQCQPLVFSSDTPVNISSSGPNTVQSTLTVNSTVDSGAVYDINVYLELTHTWLSDLIITLTSPDGTEITLLDQACDDLDNIDVVFDDKGAAVSCNINVPPALFGTLQPEEKLNTFENESVVGDWVLTVEDLVANDGGSIDSFGLDICEDLIISVDESQLSEFSLYPNPSSGKVIVNFNQNISQDIKVDIIDLNGRNLKSFKVKNSSNNFSFNLSDLSSGIYLVCLESENKTAVKKLILK